MIFKSYYRVRRLGLILRQSRPIFDYCKGGSTFFLEDTFIFSKKTTKALLLLGDTDGATSPAGGLGVLTADTDTPVVAETAMGPDLLQTLQILTKFVVQAVGHHLARLACKKTKNRQHLRSFEISKHGCRVKIVGSRLPVDNQRRPRRLLSQA